MTGIDASREPELRRGLVTVAAHGRFDNGTPCGTHSKSLMRTPRGWASAPIEATWTLALQIRARSHHPGGRRERPVESAADCCRSRRQCAHASRPITNRRTGPRLTLFRAIATRYDRPSRPSWAQCPWLQLSCASSTTALASSATVGAAASRSLEFINSATAWTLRKQVMCSVNWPALEGVHAARGTISCPYRGTRDAGATQRIPTQRHVPVGPHLPVAFEQSRGT